MHPTSEATQFVHDLLTAFASHSPGRDGGGAVILGARAIARDEDDFGVAVTYRDSRTGLVLDDEIGSVRTAMAAFDLADAAGLAALWRTELDDRVLP
jgi:hypothetical protein